MITPAGEVSGTSSLFITPEAYRMDGMPMGAGQQGMPKDMTILGLKDQNRQYIYNHDKKLVYESDLDEQEMMDLLKSYENVDAEEILGKEKVSGYPCTKKKVTTTMSVMGMNITTTETIWQSDRFEMPLKIRNEDGHISHLQNIVTQTPPSKLFRPMTGYTRVNNMMAVMGMDFSDGQMPETGTEKSGSLTDRQNSAGKPSQDDTGDTETEDMMQIMDKLMAAFGVESEQAAEMREALSYALDESRQIEMDSGAADGLWQIIPQRSGDRIGSEMQLPGSYYVVLGTQSSLAQVCGYYEGRLDPDGWQNSGSHIQNNEGFLLLTRGEQQLTVSSADDPGMEGNFKTFYSLKLTEPSPESPPSPVDAAASSGPETVLQEEEHKNVDIQTSSAKGLLFHNSDFEAGDLTNWTPSGDAFDFQPTKGDNPTARRRRQPSSHQGDYWIGTYEKYQGTTGQKPGKTQGDRPTGTLTSASFEISGDHISFLIGGGRRPDSVYVALVVDGKEVLKVTGHNNESMQRVTWDVSAYKGNLAGIVISDQHSRGWGHINADDFRYGSGE
ncbi:MAG: DUF4412 domain-containing protein [Desulfovermiculus sp.]|nr:DUF4412 domain-containing protein [Desulfovermiculus sp.]